MKKKFLQLVMIAALAGMATQVTAVSVNPEGTGEVLLYPFYTVESGQDTYVTVVNTTDYVKAVRVRLRESMNSAPVLDFNLYLAPFDHWAGVITRDTAGVGAILKTADTSCTVPAIPADGIKLNNFHYANVDSANQNADGGPEGLERTREGHIEIIEMGVVDDSARGQFGAESAATLSSDRIPEDCAVLRNAWQEVPVGSGNVVGDWEDPTANFLDFHPDRAGGLYGYGVLINPLEGTNATYDAVALAGFADKILHAAPESAYPNLAQASPLAVFVERNSYISLTFAGSSKPGLDAVSSVLTHDAVANDFVLEPSISAGTDWVVTMPTKREYVNGANPSAPFRNVWAGANGACEGLQLDYHDRAGVPPAVNEPPREVDFPESPIPQPIRDVSIALCQAANVISFLGPDSNLVSGNPDGYSSPLYPSERTQVKYPVDFDNGWAQLSLAQDNIGNERFLDADNGFRLHGLPIIGFAVQKYSNTTIEGIQSAGAFYSGVSSLKTTRHLSSGHLPVPCQYPLLGC